MKDPECAAFAYSLQGLSTRVILKRLMEECSYTHEQAQKAIKKLSEINHNAPPIPRVTAYWEKQDDGQIKWWQDNWFNDQWDVISPEEFEIRRKTLIMVYCEVEEGMPDNDE